MRAFVAWTVVDCPIVQGDPKNAATLLPWSHIVFSNLEGRLRGTFHGASAKHLPRYLQEFVYRTNRDVPRPPAQAVSDSL